MKKTIFLMLASAALFAPDGRACTNFIVTKGASTDGSVMVSYSADSHQLYGALYNYLPQPYTKGEMIKIREWDSGKPLGSIAQVKNTYSTIGNMNEYQLVIGETTFGGREELYDSTGVMDYGSLIYITLQRAKTAREAIGVLTGLANEYGYASSGETFSIADPNDAWILEIMSKGSDKGIVWVARRIPDGYVSAHANCSRITTFPLKDPANCIYSPDVISFARKKGYFSGKDADFSFRDAYAPLDFLAMRACEARVWSFFNSVADGMNQYLDFAMGHNPANSMPLWVKPYAKISPKQVFDAMRDHYEGTPMDMTTDIGAGGSGLPYRWRPMTFEVDGKTYVNERAVATQQTGFWFVSQSRSWSPDGILWFGIDDAATSALTPIYSSTTTVPECLRLGNGSIIKYSPTASFWIFNRVAQFAYLRYDYVGGEIRDVIDKWEDHKLVQVQEIDRQAETMQPEVRRAFLNDYSNETAQMLFDKWVALDNYLLVKYIDGNIKLQDEYDAFLDNGNGVDIPPMPFQPGYSEKWKRAVAADNGTILEVVE